MKNRNERREEMNAYGVILLIGAFCLFMIGVIIQTIFNIL